MRANLVALASLGAVAHATTPQDAVTFAFGDVFARDLATLGEQLGLALERTPGWDVLFDYGALTPRGTSFGLFGPGVAPVHFVAVGAAPAVTRGVAHQRLEVVATAPNGAPRWDEVTLVAHVTRALTASAADHSAVLEALVGARAGARDAGGAAPHGPGGTGTAPAAPAGAPAHVVVAHGLTTTDLRQGVLARGTAGASTGGAWEVLGQAHRARRTLRRVDVTAPGVAAFAAQTLVPQGVAGTRVVAREDNTYDTPTRDLGRGVVDFEWSAATVGLPWVGFALSLEGPLGAPLDASGAGAAVVFSVRGTTSQPNGAPRLFVALEDRHAAAPGGVGNEAHVAIDLPEITSMEQTVSIPLWRFQFANHALDTSALVRLKFAARDAAVPGAGSCVSGDLELFEPRVVRDSSLRRTPVNVFWSNDPLVHAAGGPTAPLAEEFLGQPSSVFKWFVGVSGPDVGSVPGLLAELAAVRAAGRTPHVVIELWPAPGTPTLAAIAGGTYDAYFDALFAGCRALAGRIELAPLHEANGGWYPWNGVASGALLRDAWRRIDARRDAAAAHNVALCYVVSNLPGDPSLTRRAVDGFPGDDVVDLIGVQGFESGYDTVVDSFNELFTNLLGALDVVSDLPFVATEYGFYTLPGAQFPKGQLYRWAFEDQAEGRTAAPLSGGYVFNVAKQENGAWRDWRVVDDLGVPVPELASWYPSFPGLANHPTLASPDGAEAHTATLRAHARVVARFARP